MNTPVVIDAASEPRALGTMVVTLPDFEMGFPFAHSDKVHPSVFRKLFGIKIVFIVFSSLHTFLMLAVDGSVLGQSVIVANVVRLVQNVLQFHIDFVTALEGRVKFVREDNLIKLLSVLPFQFDVASLDGSPDTLADRFALNPQGHQSAIDLLAGQKFSTLHKLAVILVGSFGPVLFLASNAAVSHFLACSALLKLALWALFGETIVACFHNGHGDSTGHFDKKIC